MQAFEEFPPAGWSVDTLSHGAVFDAVTGAVKWGPFLDAVPRTLTYRVVPVSNPSGAFRGTAAFDGTLQPITGTTDTVRFPGSFSRLQPVDYLPGASVAVEITVQPAPDVEVWAVEERFPAGWIVSDINAGGAADPLSPKLKWGPFLDATPRTFRYTLRSPADSRTDAELEAAIRLGEAVESLAAPLPLRRSRITHSVAADYRPGVPLPVVLALRPAPFVAVQAVEERLEPGWTPQDVGDGGVWDPATGRIRWGPFFDALPRDLTFAVTPPDGASVAFALAAVGRFDESTVSDSRNVQRHLDVPVSGILRHLPTNYVPGADTAVGLEVRPTDTTRVHLVEETVPAGWEFVTADTGGSWDAASRKVRWGPFIDVVPVSRDLRYSVRPPADAFGTVTFEGLGRFDGNDVPAGGDTNLAHAPPTLVRRGPARYTPGVPMTLRLEVTPVPGVELQALVEEVPAGWTVAGPSDGGLRDPIGGQLKWGPFLDRNLRTVSWTATPPSGITGPQELHGTGHFNRDAVEATGLRILAENHPPVAVPDALQFRAGEVLRVPLLRILSNDSDTDGDLLRIGSVGPASEAGGTVRVAGAFLFYTPPTSAPANDRVRYTVVDGFGGSADGVLDLSPAGSNSGQTLALVGLSAVPGGGLRARFVGIPTAPYRIFASESLLPPVTWTDIGCATAGADGRFEVVDVPPPSASSRYYRLEASATPCN